MTLNELRDLINDTCAAGYGDATTTVNMEDDPAHGGTNILGIRYSTERINDKIEQFVNIIES